MRFNYKAIYRTYSPQNTPFAIEILQPNAYQEDVIRATKVHPNVKPPEHNSIPMTRYICYINEREDGGLRKIYLFCTKYIYF